MTKPRTDTSRELFGILGPIPNKSAVKREWNKYFSDNEIDAFMDDYPASAENLHERLSEMFHFDRRGYIVSSSLSEAVFSLLDSCDQDPSTSLRAGESVNLIRNSNGVLKGYHCNIANTSAAELYHFFLTGEW